MAERTIVAIAMTVTVGALIIVVSMPSLKQLGCHPPLQAGYRANVPCDMGSFTHMLTKGETVKPRHCPGIGQTSVKKKLTPCPFGIITWIVMNNLKLRLLLNALLPSRAAVEV
jgi:hypothetical protein